MLFQPAGADGILRKPGIGAMLAAIELYDDFFSKQMKSAI